MGGLGNQLFEYALAKALAIKFNKDLIIDPRPILAEAPQRHYDLHLLNLEKEDFGSPFLRWIVRWVASVRLGRYFKTVMPYAWSFKMVRDREQGFEKELFNIKARNIVLQGYWQSYKYFEDIRPTLLKEFTFKTTPNKVNQNFLNLIESRQSVGVHIRRGDYVSNPLANQLHGLCSMDYYVQAIGIINKKVKDPHYFIFTDDPDWAEVHFIISENQNIIRHNLGVQDFEDLRLLMHCKHFIIANSSFSWWGAWLGRDPNKVVISPSKWFNIDETPIEDRIPESWIKV